jgi:hypothetical protein
MFVLMNIAGEDGMKRCHTNTVKARSNKTVDKINTTNLRRDDKNNLIKCKRACLMKK